MRIFNNYSNGYNTDSKLNTIRGLTNEYGINLNKPKEKYNEEKIIKTNCNHHYKDKE